MNLTTYGSIVYVVECTFLSNKQSSKGSSYGGGAIYNYGGTLTVYGSSFTTNSAYNGGAIYTTTSSGTTTVYTPYTFTSNSASYSSTYNDM